MQISKLAFTFKKLILATESNLIANHMFSVVFMFINRQEAAVG
jgi:hypothetical protein